MKNLELLELNHKIVDVFATAEIFAYSENIIYFISKKVLFKYDFNLNTTTELCPQNFEGVIFLKLLKIENKVCIVTRNCLYIFDLNGTNEVRTLSFENDIATIAWNPTEEIVATVSESGDVVTFSVDYENGDVFSQGRSSVLAKIPDTVYVGWGSKDTQFRGSEGKLKNQASVLVEAKPVHDKIPTISWRGNGEMFVVNYWLDNKRQFVVFETPCNALYRSEDTSGLQRLVAWRPTGNMIATLAETNKQTLVIFEKNGQKRFEVDLDFGNVVVKEIKWSTCAQILTILTQDIITKTQTIHLLTSSNYKWYKKQSLKFNVSNPVLTFEWLETTQFTFTLLVITKYEIVKYNFASVVNGYLGICCVIDGKNLQITDFNDSVLPPIMCSKKIQNSVAINFVTLHKDLVVIVDTENYLKVFDITNPEVIRSCINLDVSINDLSPIPLSCHHFVSKIDDLSDVLSEVYFVGETAFETVIHSIDLQTGEVTFINTTIDPLRHLLHIPNVVDVDGLKQIDPMLYRSDNCDNVVQQEVKIIDNDNEIYNCRLMANCHFKINEEKISDCVNSFIIFDDYLLYTTKHSELHCLRFSKEFLKGEHFRRNIEQGATIVTAIQNSPKIVLQLPRGNLETISCRLISIDILDRLLNSGKWEEAIRFIRLEKLNANLLFDLNSKRFLNKIDRFINAAQTINELNSLCLEFEEGNVLKTIYKNWGQIEENPNKVNTIFKEIFEYFDRVDYAPYITTIIIIKLNFFTLLEALVYIQDLLRRSYDDDSLKPKLFDAINTLKTYGCDQEKLYSEALLLYDLDLAHFVASCCQLDPRIYEPQINNFKNLSEIERRYEINLFGKRPKSAIMYLLRCPKADSEQILSFMKNHNVSREAYENCPTTNQHFKVVSRAFAQNLSRRGAHQEAGVILKRANLLEEALEEFMLSLRWREVVDLVQELEYDDIQKSQVFNELAKKLTQNHIVKDAAILYEFYLNNYEMAVKVLLDNYFIEEAVHIAKKYKRSDIIISEVIPLLEKHKIYLEEKITDLYNLYEKYKNRLEQVRKLKAEKFNNLSYEGDDRDDLFSDAGSTITKSSRSSRSRSSTASSRNRRKEEKKKQDLRKGGIYEDIALIRVLYSTIQEFYKKGDEVRSCCILLLEESNMSFNEIKIFHDLYWKISGNIKNGISEIWPSHFYVHNHTQDIRQLADLENLEHLDLEYRTPPNGYVQWKLTVF